MIGIELIHITSVGSSNSSGDRLRMRLNKHMQRIMTSDKRRSTPIIPKIATKLDMTVQRHKSLLNETTL